MPKKSTVSRKEMIAGLNDDLAGEFQAILMYVTYAAAVTGPHRPMLKQFFSAEVPEELAHAQDIVDAFAALPDAGVLSVGGKMVDRPHLVQARRVLARSR